MTIDFYVPADEHGYLSNVSPHGITLAGRYWPTVEHYFQAQQFAGTPHEDAVHRAPTPHRAAELGRDRARPRRADWEAVQDSVMRVAVAAKFAQHDALRTKLLATGDATLVAHRGGVAACGVDREDHAASTAETPRGGFSGHQGRRLQRGSGAASSASTRGGVFRGHQGRRLQRAPGAASTAGSTRGVFSGDQRQRLQRGPEAASSAGTRGGVFRGHQGRGCRGGGPVGLPIHSSAHASAPRCASTPAWGYQSFDILRLVNTHDSILYGIFAGITAPLLNRNGIAAEYFSANSRQMQAVVNYERAILTAYIEADTGPNLLRTLSQSYALQARQVAHLAEAVEVSPLLLTSAEVQHAQVEYPNTRTLRDGNVVSPNELALAQANLNRAGAERDLAQAHLRFSRLDAPFDGIVGRLMVRRGSLLSEGDLLTVLADGSQMWVYFNVSEREYLAYRRAHTEGAPAEVHLRMANDEIFPHAGTIQTIEADFKNETGTIAFRAGFPDPEGLLRRRSPASGCPVRADAGGLTSP